MRDRAWGSCRPHLPSSSSASSGDKHAWDWSPSAGLQPGCSGSRSRRTRACSVRARAPGERDPLLPLVPDARANYEPAATAGEAIRVSTAIADLAAVAAYVSYWHAYAVVRAHGETRVTTLLEPVTIDGLVYVSSMVTLDAARHRLPVPVAAEDPSRGWPKCGSPQYRSRTELARGQSVATWNRSVGWALYHNRTASSPKRAVVRFRS
jgi:hypothetical protein